MNTRLAYDPIVLSAGDITVRLRPSLRAGALMAQSYSLENLLEQLRQCHLGTITHIVAIACDDPVKATHFIAAKIQDGLYPLESLISPIFEFIALSFGLSYGDDADDRAATGKPLSFAEVFTELFEFATGWLKWSAADTWAATPAEIMHARNGHFAMLRAIHGGNDDSDAPRDLPSEHEVKSGIDRLRQLAGEVG